MHGSKYFDIMQALFWKRDGTGVAVPDREGLIAELRRLQAGMRGLRMHGAGPFMDLDLTIPQLRVIFLLMGSEPMSMSSLAQELGITLSACTHLLDKLVRAGFVVRSEDAADRRVVRCSLTEKGHTLAERLRQSTPFERPEFLDRLSVEDLRVIVHAMSIFQRVMAEIDAGQGEPVPRDASQPGKRPDGDDPQL